MIIVNELLLTTSSALVKARWSIGEN